MPVWLESWDAGSPLLMWDGGIPRLPAASAPRCVASLLACCAGKRFAFPQLRTLAGSNPSAWRRRFDLLNVGGSLLVWDGGIPRLPAASAPRCVASLLACCAGKRFAFPQLRTLAGSNPSICPQESALG